MTEIERKTKNFLVALAEGERGLESARAALCRTFDFVPGDAFSRLNRDNSAGIEVPEIINFLKDNGVTDVENNEAAHLVRYYDTLEKERNNILTVQEFSSIILPCEDNQLREDVLAKEAKEWKDVGRLSTHVEGQIADIFVREVELMRKLEALKRALFAEAEEGK